MDVFAPEVGQPSTLQMIKTGLGAIWSREAVAEVRRRVERRKPDLVHCHNLFPALSPAVLRATDEVPLLVTLHNYRLLCLPATFLRDGEVCEDCLGRLPWPGVVHGCYQGSVSASAVLASSLLLHKAIGTFGRISLFLAISDFVRQKHIEGGLSSRRILSSRTSPGRLSQDRGLVSTSCISADCLLRKA